MASPVTPSYSTSGPSPAERVEDRGDLLGLGVRPQLGRRPVEQLLLVPACENGLRRFVEKDLGLFVEGGAAIGGNADPNRGDGSDQGIATPTTSRARLIAGTIGETGRATHMIAVCL